MLSSRPVSVIGQNALESASLPDSRLVLLNKKIFQPESRLESDSSRLESPLSTK
jgi:hypothetical protein